jgi:mono/diheme cytochrome c family protein
MIRLSVPILILVFANCVHAAGPPGGTNLHSGPTASAAAEPGTPPFDLADPARIAAGKARFGATCTAYCHGNEGSGGRTPAFKGRSDFTPEALFRVITDGRAGADVMPPYAAMPLEKRWELVAYILYLSRQKAE